MFDTLQTTSNRQMAALLFNIATLLRDRQDNPYRIRAYERGARALMRRRAPDMAAALRDADHTLPHPKWVLGDSLQSKLREAARTGTSDLLTELCETLPPAVLTLLHVPGVGPRTAVALVNAGIETPEQMLAAARSGALYNVPGFGRKRVAQAAQLSLFGEENPSLPSPEGEGMNHPTPSFRGAGGFPSPSDPSEQEAA